MVFDWGTVWTWRNSFLFKGNFRQSMVCMERKTGGTVWDGLGIILDWGTVLDCPDAFRLEDDFGLGKGSGLKGRV